MTGLVDTYFGTVQGQVVTAANTNVFQFLGIPYAEKPLGNLRFRNPSPFIKPWKGVLDATSYGPFCLQADSTGKELAGSSEDCLYLNIWVPQIVNESCDKLPVMIFIHGGSFNFGTSSEDSVNGASLAKNGNVIVVTLNYRLGFFGFLTDDQAQNSNQGLRDQQMAIQWVHENIGSFGGNSGKISIFGHSAGAISVGILLLNPNLPIVSGIMQSGHPYSFLRPDSIEKGQEKSLKFSKHFKCSSEDDLVLSGKAITCLKAIESSKLIEYGGVNRMHSTILPNPIFGDSFLPYTAKNMLNGSQSMVKLNLKPLLIGFNQDEGELFVRRNNLKVPVSSKDAISQLNILFDGKLTKEQIKKVEKFYIRDEMDATQLQSAIFDAYGDLYVYCGSLFFAQAYSKFEKPENSKVYIYKLKYKASKPKIPIENCNGICHGEELPTVFGLALNDTFNYSKDDVKVALYVIDKWTKFAKEG